MLCSVLLLRSPRTRQSAAGQTVFVSCLKHNWADFKGSADAPFINERCCRGIAIATIFNPPGLHPSEPNYLWLEAGTIRNFQRQ